MLDWFLVGPASHSSINAALPVGSFNILIPNASLSVLLALGREQGLRGKRRKGRAGDAGNPPIGQYLRAELLIEPDRRRIPVQHRPLESAAASLDREPGEMDQKRAPVAATPKRRANKQILEIKAAATEESGEIMKKQRKTGRLVALPCQNHFDQGSLSEQRAFDVVLACDAQMLKPLEVRKPVN